MGTGVSVLSEKNGKTILAYLQVMHRRRKIYYNWIWANCCDIKAWEKGMKKIPESRQI